jgi:hypothetical protein
VELPQPDLDGVELGVVLWPDLPDEVDEDPD